MAQAIDTLEVIFTANLLPLTGSLERISGQLMGVKGATDIADMSLRNMAGALDFGMEGLKRGANSAGQAVGNAFARGLRSKKGQVDQAVRYLTQSALEALRRLLNTGAPAALDVPRSAQMEKFDRASMEWAGNGAGQAMDITIPINVDGIRLGEACVRGINALGRMTGRSVINMQ